jgi:hypothetical protein
MKQAGQRGAWPTGVSRLDLMYAHILDAAALTAGRTRRTGG